MDDLGQSDTPAQGPSWLTGLGVTESPGRCGLHPRKRILRVGSCFDRLRCTDAVAPVSRDAKFYSEFRVGFASPSTVHQEADDNKVQPMNPEVIQQILGGEVIQWPEPEQLTVTGTEARVCGLIAQRQAFGLAKYGTSVENNPLPLRAWLQHALEESLDQAIYLKRAIDEIDGFADDGR